MILDLWLAKREDGWAFLARMCADLETMHIPAIIASRAAGKAAGAGRIAADDAVPCDGQAVRCRGTAGRDRGDAWSRAGAIASRHPETCRVTHRSFSREYARVGGLTQSEVAAHPLPARDSEKDRNYAVQQGKLGGSRLSSLPLGSERQAGKPATTTKTPHCVTPKGLSRDGLTEKERSDSRRPIPFGYTEPARAQLRASVANVARIPSRTGHRGRTPCPRHA